MKKTKKFKIGILILICFQIVFYPLSSMATDSGIQQAISDATNFTHSRGRRNFYNIRKIKDKLKYGV